MTTVRFLGRVLGRRRRRRRRKRKKKKNFIKPQI